MPECDFCHKQKDNITVCNDIDDIPTDKLICDDCMNTLPERFIKNEELAGSSGYCNPIFAEKIASWWTEEIEKLIIKIKKNERKRIIKIIESTPIPSRQGTGKAIKEIINLINLEL